MQELSDPPRSLTRTLFECSHSLIEMLFRGQVNQAAEAVVNFLQLVHVVIESVWIHLSAHMHSRAVGPSHSSGPIGEKGVRP